MRNLIALNVLLLIAAQSNAQDSVEIKAYWEVLQRIDSAYYTRIPNRDFDRILTYEVNNAVNDKLTFWLTITGAVVAIISGLGLYSAKKFVTDAIRQAIEERMGPVQKELANVNNDQIKEIRAELQKDLDRVNGEIKVMNQAGISTQKFIYGEELEKIKSEVDRNAPADQVYGKLKTLLNEIERIGYKEILPNVVDELMRVSYYLRKHQEMEDLIDMYGFKDPELLGNSYFTASLIGLNNYNLFSSTSGRSSALKFLDKTLEITPGYGTAQAVKLEIFMMDFERAASEPEKQKAKEDARRVLTEINNSILSPQETIARLDGDKKIKSFVKYVNLIYEQFPKEMEVMKEKAQQGTPGIAPTD